jgi:hypothetical protein
MNCEYLKCKGFYIVFTPHFLSRQAERKGDEIFEGLDFDHIFATAEADQCYALPVKGSLFMYIKKKCNEKRRRWELELISLTPDTHLKTKNENHAIPFPQTDFSEHEQY